MKHLLFAVAALLSLPTLSRAGEAPKLEDLIPGQLLAQAYVLRGADYIERAKADPKMVIETVSDAKRTDALYLAVMFVNPSKDNLGIAHVTFTFTMTYPDGTKQPGGREFKAGDGPMTEALQKAWIFAPTKIKLPLTANSAAGTYKFNVVVKDMVSGTEYKSDISVAIK